MDWANERWVKLYTRDTVTWTLLSWQARALLCLVLRKVDRSGRLELGRHGAKGLAAAVAMPVEVVEIGLEDLLGEGVAVLDGSALFLPHFEEAQQAQTSVAERSRRHRERKESNADATRGNAEQRAATQSNAMQRDATARNDQNRSEQIRTEEIREEPPYKSPQGDDYAGQAGSLPVGLGAPDVHPDQETPAQGKSGPVDAMPGGFALTHPLSKEESSRARAQAVCRDVVGYLNAKTGRSGSALLDVTAEGSVDLCGKLIAVGYTADKIRAVIDAKVSEWRENAEMAKYLKPGTLFRLSNFKRYVADLADPAPQPAKTRGRFAAPTSEDAFQGGKVDI